MWSAIQTIASTCWQWLPEITIALKFCTALIGLLDAIVSLTRRIRRWWNRRNNLVSRPWEADLTGAAATTEQLLTDQLRVLGPDHPETLVTRSNLADGRGEAGDADGAVVALSRCQPTGCGYSARTTPTP